VCERESGSSEKNDDLSFFCKPYHRTKGENQLIDKIR
jgi:hypothetical protein